MYCIDNNKIFFIIQTKWSKFAFVSIFSVLVKIFDALSIQINLEFKDYKQFKPNESLMQYVETFVTYY